MANAPEPPGGKKLTTASQTLTGDEKDQVASNLGVIAVRAQTLTADEKTQVRTNIGAGVPETGTHLVAEAQTLSAPQKVQVKTNLGITSAANIADPSASAVAGSDTVSASTIESNFTTTNGAIASILNILEAAGFMDGAA